MANDVLYKIILETNTAETDLKNLIKVSKDLNDSFKDIKKNSNVDVEVDKSIGELQKTDKAAKSFLKTIEDLQKQSEINIKLRKEGLQKAESEVKRLGKLLKDLDTKDIDIDVKIEAKSNIKEELTKQKKVIDNFKKETETKKISIEADNKISGIFSKITEGMEDVGETLSKLGGKVGIAGELVSGLAGKLGSLGGPAGVGAAAAALAIGAITAAINELNEMVDEAIEATKKMNEEFGSEHLGLVSEDFAKISAEVDLLSKVSMQEAANIAQTVKLLATNTGISFIESFNLIRDNLKGLSKEEGNEFLDQAREFPTHFTKLGMEAGRALEIIKQGITTGVKDKIPDFIKEFGLRRAAPLSKEDLAALDSAGFAGVWEEQGKGAISLDNFMVKLKETVDKLKAEGRDITALMKAIGGSPGEDLGDSTEALDVFDKKIRDVAFITKGSLSDAFTAAGDRLKELAANPDRLKALFPDETTRAVVASILDDYSKRQISIEVANKRILTVTKEQTNEIQKQTALEAIYGAEITKATSNRHQELERQKESNRLISEATASENARNAANKKNQLEIAEIEKVRNAETELATSRLLDLWSRVKNTVAKAWSESNIFSNMINTASSYVITLLELLNLLDSTAKSLKEIKEDTKKEQFYSVTPPAAPPKAIPFGYTGGFPATTTKTMPTTGKLMPPVSFSSAGSPAAKGPDPTNAMVEAERRLKGWLATQQGLIDQAKASGEVSEAEANEKLIALSLDYTDKRQSLYLQIANAGGKYRRMNLEEEEDHTNKLADELKARGDKEIAIDTWLEGRSREQIERRHNLDLKGLEAFHTFRTSVIKLGQEGNLKLQAENNEMLLKEDLRYHQERIEAEKRTLIEITQNVTLEEFEKLELIRKSNEKLEEMEFETQKLLSEIQVNGIEMRKQQLKKSIQDIEEVTRKSIAAVEKELNTSTFRIELASLEKQKETGEPMSQSSRTSLTAETALSISNKLVAIKKQELESITALMKPDIDKKLALEEEYKNKVAKINNDLQDIIALNAGNDVLQQEAKTKAIEDTTEATNEYTLSIGYLNTNLETLKNKQKEVSDEVSKANDLMLETTRATTLSMITDTQALEKSFVELSRTAETEFGKNLTKIFKDIAGKGFMVAIETSIEGIHKFTDGFKAHKAILEEVTLKTEALRVAQEKLLVLEGNLRDLAKDPTKNAVQIAAVSKNVEAAKVEVEATKQSLQTTEKAADKSSLSISTGATNTAINTTKDVLSGLHELQTEMLKQQLAGIDAVIGKRNEEIKQLEELNDKNKELREEEEERNQLKLDIQNTLAEQRIKELEDISDIIPEAEKEALKENIEREKAKIQEIDYNKEVAKSAEERRIEELQAANQRSEEDKKRLQRKQFDIDKKAKFIDSQLAGALGVVNALTIQPPYLIPIAIALAATTAAVAGATILSQPNPYNKGTLRVQGADTSKDSVYAYLTPGEAVIPATTNKEYFPAIKAIFNKEIPSALLNDFVLDFKNPEINLMRTSGFQSTTTGNDAKLITQLLANNRTQVNVNVDEGGIGVVVQKANKTTEYLNKKLNGAF